MYCKNGKYVSYEKLIIISTEYFSFYCFIIMSQYIKILTDS